VKKLSEEKVELVCKACNHVWWADSAGIYDSSTEESVIHAVCPVCEHDEAEVKKEFPFFKPIICTRASYVCTFYYISHPMIDVANYAVSLAIRSSTVMVKILGIYLCVVLTRLSIRRHIEFPALLQIS
jgi:hypothetical protein